MVEMSRRPERAGIQEHHDLITGGGGLWCIWVLLGNSSSGEEVAEPFGWMRRSECRWRRELCGEGRGCRRGQVQRDGCVCVCYTGFTASVNEGQMVTFDEKTLDTFQAATLSTRPTSCIQAVSGRRKLQVDPDCWAVSIGNFWRGLISRKIMATVDRFCFYILQSAE